MPRMQVLFGVNQRLRVEDVDSPLVNVRPVKSVLMVIVTGDRGLCGGYNNFVLKKARTHAAALASHNTCSCELSPVTIPAHAELSKGGWWLPNLGADCQRSAPSRS
jgi:F0F1-type ATP synthase gamma subunit